MSTLPFLKSILELVAVRDGKLIIGRSEILVPKGFFFDATADVDLIEELVRKCFVRKRAMWEGRDLENINAVIGSVDLLVKDLDRSRQEDFLRSSGSRAIFYRDLLGVWSDKSSYLLKRLLDMREGNDHEFGSDRPFSHHDFMRELVEYRWQTLGYVEALLALIPDDREFAREGRRLIDKAKDEAIKHFSLSIADFVTPQFALS